MALSSGEAREAELAGIVKGAVEGMGLASVARDLGVEVELSVRVCVLTAAHQSAFVAGPVSGACGAWPWANPGFRKESDRETLSLSSGQVSGTRRTS
eukprot:1595254-Alexandrium_andersonii.AAC.1